MKTMKCQLCGKEITKTGGRKYCTKCRIAVDKELNRKYCLKHSKKYKEARDMFGQVGEFGSGKTLNRMLRGG